MKKILILCIIAIFLASCVSMQNNTNNNFEYYELQNGIPLIVSNTDSSQIVSLQISVRGGTALLSPELSGLDSAIFDMMTMGSASYSYDSIQQVRYDTQGNFYSSSNQLGSTLSLTSIDYYFDELLPILIDGFLNPTLNEDEYKTLMTSISQSLQYKMQDANSLLTKIILDERYKNHPYATSSSATVDSIDNITIEAMRKQLSAIHNANRIAIIAVGNFNIKHLLKELNSSIGLLERKDFSIPATPPATQATENIFAELESAQGSGYVSYTVPAPVPGSKDEIPFRIASDIYSEILFNLVRETYGATYSIGASYVYSKAPFGMVRAFKVSDLENISAYMLEAESFMVNNTIISGKDSNGEFLYDTIEDRLEGYKNTLINSQFYSSQTNAAISSQILSSLLLFNDAEQYKNFTQRVRGITAEDIKRVFNTYFVESEKQWFAVTGIGEQNRFIIGEQTP